VLRLTFLVLIFLSPLPGWGDDSPSKAGGVISSFTIPDDWVSYILPAGYRHRSLVPERSELHGYQINANDARDLAKADLIVGLSPELEPWLADWIKANRREDATLWLTLEAKPTLQAKGKQSAPDPHVWTDPIQVLKIIEKLREKLQSLYPQASMEDGYNQLVKDVIAVDNILGRSFALIPINQRRIITQHANLGPFAHRYGLTVASTILQSTSTEAADPSAKQFSKLLETIRIQGVRVVVVDDGQNDAIAQQLCRDTGLPPPLQLSFEFLEPKGLEGGTWAGMMLRNGRILQAALLKP